MELVVFVLYVVGFVLTARHRIYRTKLRNEGRDWYGFTLEPRVYGLREYQVMQAEAMQSLDARSGRLLRQRYGDPRSDRHQVALFAAVFPLYWILVPAAAVISTLLFGGVRQTPGEVESERERRQEELDRLYRETERLRKEQDG